jgi:hypothetical protein
MRFGRFAAFKLIASEQTKPISHAVYLQELSKMSFLIQWAPERETGGRILLKLCDREGNASV